MSTDEITPSAPSDSAAQRCGPWSHEEADGKLALVFHAMFNTLEENIEAVQMAEGEGCELVLLGYPHLEADPNVTLRNGEGRNARVVEVGKRVRSLAVAPCEVPSGSHGVDEVVGDVRSLERRRDTLARGDVRLGPADPRLGAVRAASRSSAGRLARGEPGRLIVG